MYTWKYYLNKRKNQNFMKKKAQKVDFRIFLDAI